jgi:chloramphenicol 3-O phosphotransferase
LCCALQARLDAPFWHYSIDHFRGGVLPWDRIKRGDFAWPDLRPAFFDGFHRCLPALAGAGNDLIVEHIVETAPWMSDLNASAVIAAWKARHTPSAFRRMLEE